MTPAGPRHERETVITFNDEDVTAEIWTASGVVYNKLKRLGYEHTEDGRRHGVFRCPKAQISFRKGKKPPTDAQRLRGYRLAELSRQKPIAIGRPDKERGVP